MDIKKSSYYRIFRFLIFLVLSVMTVIGLATASISSAFYKKAKLTDLEKQGEFFLDCVKKEGKNDDYIRFVMKNYLDEYGIKVYLYDSEGNCLISCDENTAPLDSEVKRHSLDNAFLGLISEEISSNEPMLLYCNKFFMSSEMTDSHQVYALFCGSTQDINDFTFTLTLCYITASFIGFLFIYIIMKRRVKRYIDYEQKLVEVSGKYAKGDFSEKIPSGSTGSLGEIAKHIESLATDVETSEETSKTFIANVSHELRTPITTIGGFVGGILDGTIKKSQQMEYLDIVHKEIQRLTMLISSMLNMSRFESGTLSPNFRETNLTDLVIQIVLMFEKKIEEKNLEIEELDSSRLMAVVDPDLMKQVIYNLVENAVKFVNVGGTLSFTFEKNDGKCIVGIRNTGEGLKDSEIQQVFDRFYKTDASRGKDKTGLGLGLSISRKIVHLHKGHIVVKSVYGEYTEFQIQIPDNLKEKV